MKRFTKIMALLMAMIMILSGCMTEHDEVTINADGTAKLIQTITLDKEQTDTMLTNMGYTDPSALFADAAESGQEWKVITGEDGKEYYYTTMVTSCKNLKKLGNATSSTFTNGMYATTDTIYGVTAITSEEEYAEMGINPDEIGYDPSTVMTYTMELTFSKPVVKTTGTIDAENPNKVTFNIAMDKPTTVFATTNPKVTKKATRKLVNASNSIKKPEIKSVKVSKVKGKKATATLKLKKIKDAKFYIEYATDKQFMDNYGLKVTKKTKAVIKNLKKGKKYYFRVYAVKKNYAGIEIYSDNSKRKSLKMVKKAKK